MFWQTPHRHSLTPDSAVLRPHRDVYAVVLCSAVCQRLLQGLRIQHKAIIEAAGDVVHLQQMRHKLEKPAAMGICVHTVMVKDLNDLIKNITYSGNACPSATIQQQTSMKRRDFGRHPQTCWMIVSTVFVERRFFFFFFKTPTFINWDESSNKRKRINCKHHCQHHPSLSADNYTAQWGFLFTEYLVKD